jgi:hypothetical protein
MNYSTNRSYRDSIMIEVEKTIKKLDEPILNSEKSFLEKIKEFIKLCMSYLKWK